MLVVKSRVSNTQQLAALIVFHVVVVTITPAVQCVSPSQLVATFTCRTTTSSLLWIYERTNQIFYKKDSTLDVPERLGPFIVVQLNSIVTSAEGNSVALSSTATVNVSNLTINLTITCDGNGNGVDGKDALLIVSANGMFTLNAPINVTPHPPSWRNSRGKTGFYVPSEPLGWDI